MSTHTNVVESINKFIDNLQEGKKVNVQLFEQTSLETIHDALKNDIVSQYIVPVNLIKFYGSPTWYPKFMDHNDKFRVHNRVSFTNLISVPRRDAKGVVNSIGTKDSFIQSL